MVPDCTDLFFLLPINRQICCKTWCHKLSDLLKIIFGKRLKIVCHFFLFLIKDFCQYVGWSLIVWWCLTPLLTIF
jgi:hypothetical protein